jgi:hypothetical protein
MFAAPVYGILEPRVGPFLNALLWLVSVAVAVTAITNGCGRQ